MNATWEVIVGNIGSVYCFRNEAGARAEYAEWVATSESGRGRAAGEPVTLMKDKVPVLEHDPDQLTE